MTVAAPDMKHLEFLKTITDGDHLALMQKEATYRGSWKKRGGVGAYMMLARKWDRIESMMENKFSYDIFDGVYVGRSGEDGTVLAEVRDLRRYLVLVEAEMVARGVVPFDANTVTWTTGTPEDGGQHESVYPWITERREFGDFQEISLVNGKYRLVTHLPPPIPAEHYQHLKHLYVQAEGGLVLKIEQCPASVRSFYSSCETELNHHELQNLPLPIWLKSYLYRWREQEGKYVLANPAFHDENR